MPVTLPFFYKKEIKTGFEEKDSPPRRSRALWVVVAIIFNIFLAASAIIISDRLKKREYIPPEEVPAVVEIPCKNPIDVALVIDRSSSMGEGGSSPPQPITDAKNAAKTFVEAINVTTDLEKTDRVAVVSYSVEATLDIGLSNNTEAINSIIDNIPITGTTNIGAGIQTAVQEIINNGRDTASKAIVVLSDGVANEASDGQSCRPYWPTAHTECTQDVINQAQSAKDAGIRVYTIGLNFDWIAENHPGSEVIAEDTLRQAASGEENYFAAPESSDLENVYRAIAKRVCELGLVSGSVFNDWDQDGIWDEEEPALVGWELTFADGGESQTTITDENGAYAFTSLSPGSYLLSITDQEGWIQILAPVPNVNLAEGQSIEELDFAYYNPNETHLTCQEESCLPTAGGGIDECATDQDCIVPPPPTHKECLNEQCVEVDGAGVDECVTNSDCLIPPEPTHRICSGDSCVEIPGAGTDQCSTDADCTAEPTPTPTPTSTPTSTPTPTPTPTHKTCINDRCLAVSGAGSDTCGTDSDCVYEAPRVHKTCNNGQCLEVPGEGDNECISNYDCESAAQPTGGADTPAASPSDIPATAWINPTLTIFLISFLFVILGIAI